MACCPLLPFDRSGAESPVLGKGLPESVDTTDQHRVLALCSLHTSASRLRNSCRSVPSTSELHKFASILAKYNTVHASCVYACTVQSVTAGMPSFTTDVVPCNMYCSTCTRFPMSHDLLLADKSLCPTCSSGRATQEVDTPHACSARFLQHPFAVSAPGLLASG